MQLLFQLNISISRSYVELTCPSVPRTWASSPDGRGVDVQLYDPTGLDLKLMVDPGDTLRPECSGDFPHCPGSLSRILGVLLGGQSP